jgi:hypothetical protein
MNDDQLIEISRSVDSYMSTLLMKYETLTPLSLTAILLARSMVLNKETGSAEDFLKLASNISQDPPMERNETKVH